MAEIIVPRYYWDACVFLSSINNGPADRIPIINMLFGDLDDQKIQIVTSDVSITEVACAVSEKDSDILDSKIEAKIDSFWHPSSPIKLIEFHQLVAEDSKKLIRGVLPKGWRLKPLDAIHLASAKRHGVAEFHTYDEHLFKYAEIMGFPICAPHRDADPDAPKVGDVSLFNMDKGTK